MMAERRGWEDPLDAPLEVGGIMPTPQVAIVDDEPGLTAVVAMALEEEGISVDTFTDARRFLAALDCGADYTILVCDLRMPGLDGLELIRQLRDRQGPRRIVIMSGCPDRARDTAASIAQTDGFEIVATVSKPFAVAELAATLKDALTPVEPGVADLRRAMQRRELVVFYQPVFSLLRDGCHPVRYVEALVRWRHPRSGLMLPGQFLPMIETAEDWRRLSTYVLSTAAADLAAWQAQGFMPAMAVNLPPEILTDQTIVQSFDEILASHGIRPDQIILEITEEGAMTLDANARTVLTRLVFRGYRLSLDDYGMGHSSLRRLYDVPFDHIKLDKSFVSRAGEDPRARSIIRSSVDLASALNLSVCAEGVETVESLQAVRACGCDYVQGFGLCHPSAAEIVELQYSFRGDASGDRAGSSFRQKAPAELA